MTRVKCLAFVRTRDQDRCRYCGASVQYTNQAAPNFGEVHEVKPRSLGGDPLDPENCVLLCQNCHRWREPCVHPGPFHTRKLTIVPGNKAFAFKVVRLGNCGHCGLKGHKTKQCHLAPG